MYCPTCGTQLTQELAYCPRCGANLAPLERAAGISPARLTGATWALAVTTTVVTLGGLGMVFAFISFALSRGLPMSKGIFGLMFFFLSVVVVIASLLVAQLSRVISLYTEAGEEPPAKKAKRRLPKLDAHAPVQLEATREPLASVTDHTTRTFEPVPRERQTRS
ncbi:MAG TPA: hypothetical protein VFX96_07990 [Pyrinomonadaceae bacterium]|nr:hypothetical protein [Pyrinomonadaceae bacterium]